MARWLILHYVSPGMCSISLDVFAALGISGTFNVFAVLSARCICSTGAYWTGQVPYAFSVPQEHYHLELFTVGKLGGLAEDGSVSTFLVGGE